MGFQSSVSSERDDSRTEPGEASRNHSHARLSATKPTPTEPDRIVTNECFTDIFASEELSTFVKSIVNLTNLSGHSDPDSNNSNYDIL